MAGWNGSEEGSVSPRPKETVKSPSHVRGLVAGLAVVVLSLCAYFVFFADAGDLRDVKRKGKGGLIADVGERNGRRDSEPSAASVAVDARSEAVSPDGVAVSVESGSACENPVTGTDVVAKVEKPKKKPVFENGTDQLIAMATGVPEGCLIPPLPSMTPADTDRFIETLKKPIAIDEKDSDAVRAAKERVQQVREQIAQWLKDDPGKELGAILNEHREEFNHAAEMQAEVKKGLMEYLEAGDVDGARKYLTTMNLALQQVGISEVEMPANQDETETEGETTDE